MSEEEFAAYEDDWFKDRPKYMGRFYNGFHDCTGMELFMIGSKIEADYKAVMDVLQITNKGTVYADVVFTAKDDDTKLCVIRIVGKGGTFGTTLNLIGDGMNNCGKQLGKILYYAVR